MPSAAARHNTGTNPVLNGHGLCRNSTSSWMKPADASRAVPIYISELFSRETRTLFLDFLARARPVMLALGVWRGFRSLAGALRMTRRWPSSEFARYPDQPLGELRREFNIEVVPRRTAEGTSLGMADV